MMILFYFFALALTSFSCREYFPHQSQEQVSEGPQVMLEVDRARQVPELANICTSGATISRQMQSRRPTHAHQFSFA